MREELVWLDEESPRARNAVQASLEFVGALGVLLFASIRGLFSGRLEWRETLHQMAFIGAASAPIVALTSAFTGAVVTLYSASLFVEVGGGNFVGGALAVAMFRELAPILTGIMVTARCGSAIAAQLGTMKITEQIDALRALAVSPIQYLVIPRVLASLVMFPMLGMIANFAGIVGGWVVADAFGIGLSSFLQSIRLLAEPFDLIGGLIKTLVFALIVSLVSAQQGLAARGGAVGVGRATTRAVVLSMVLIFAANYFLADLLFAKR
ncbi:MAG: ABC transporter permease [Fimbriimonadales bacterium]|nr:ABC transporter permease [Fimbriimonadales bacterium]MDW8051426.1 ABC transporter permease [Armatimonadota bacterium]